MIIIQLLIYTLLLTGIIIIALATIGIVRELLNPNSGDKQ